ncbi:hypothetical protein ABPG74_014044 [Tetrahymena malaccensis]
MGDSFESVNLEDYVVDVKDCLIEYDIKEEKKKKGCIIYKGFIKNTTQGVKIFKRPLNFNDLNQKIRFDNLIKAFNQGVVLADNIFIGQDVNKQYFSYVIEPWFKNNQTIKNQNKFQRLSDIIKRGELDSQRKQRLFQNLVISLKCLHQIGEAHYEICPKNIWIEDNYLVYLRPFKIDKQNYKDSLKDYGNNQLFYISPEVYFEMLYERQLKQGIVYSQSPIQKQLDQQDQIILDMQTDLWGLGCIFAEMFFCQAPIFSSSSLEQQAFSYYLVLGIPEKEEAYYIQENHHQQLCDLLIEKAKYEDLPILKHIMNKVPQKQSEILTSLLEFHPQNRVNCVNLLKYPFFQQHINASPMFSPQKQKISADKMSLFDFSVSQRTNQKNQFYSQPNQNQLKNEGGSNKKQYQFQEDAFKTEGQFQNQNIQKIQGNFYTQQPNSYQNHQGINGNNSDQKRNENWWNNDFSEQKSLQNNLNVFDSNQKNIKPFKNSDNKSNCKNNILHMDTYNPCYQYDKIEQQNTNKQQIQNNSPQYQQEFMNIQQQKNSINSSNQKNYPSNQINRQTEPSRSQNNLFYKSNQTSPNPKISNDQQNLQKNPNNQYISSLQSQRSPDFSIRNQDQQQSVSLNSRNHQQSMNNQDQMLSANKSNSNFSCNLTPIPHKIYQPSSNRFELMQNNKEKMSILDEFNKNESNNNTPQIQVNNIFDTQRPKFFLSQPQSQKGGMGYLQPQIQISQNRSFQNTQNRSVFNNSDEQNISNVTQIYDNKSAYMEYNDRINRLFGKSTNKQCPTSSAKGNGILPQDQNEQIEEEYSCVLEIKIKSLTNIFPNLASEGVLNCKVDIPYIDQQLITLEGDAQFDNKLLQNQKRIIPTQLDLSQAFNYKIIKQVLSEQPIQVRLYNTNQELYAHAFLDLSFNFLLKNEMIQDELLWQKPVQQWYHLINPEDPNQSYGKIKIETNVVLLKKIQRNSSFIQNKRKSSNSLLHGNSSSKQQTTQANRSFNCGSRKYQNNQSLSSINNAARKFMKKNSSLNNLDYVQNNDNFQVLKQIELNLTMLDEELKEKEKSLL